jgi:hypothetical protein
MNRKDTVTLDDILDEIMLREQESNHQALKRWCKRYPEHTVELTRFFATWAVQEVPTERPAIDEELVASRMVSHALNLLHSQRAAAEAQVQTASDTRLYKIVRARGVSDITLVSECALDRSLFAKLDRHLIVFTSIPQACIARLARVLECAAETIITAIRGEPIPLNSYKAKGKPTLRQEEFLDAVATSDLPDKSKQEWNRIAAGETSE